MSFTGISSFGLPTGMKPLMTVALSCSLTVAMKFGYLRSSEVTLLTRNSHTSRSRLALDRAAWAMRIRPPTQNWGAVSPLSFYLTLSAKTG